MTTDVNMDKKLDVLRFMASELRHNLKISDEIPNVSDAWADTIDWSIETICSLNQQLGERTDEWRTVTRNSINQIEQLDNANNTVSKAVDIIYELCEKIKELQSGKE